MLADITSADRIYIITGYTDLRKSVDGLCAVVADLLHEDAGGSSLYLFCGKRCDRIKALLHEPDGFVLIYKRLDAHGRYQWPRSAAEVRPLSRQEYRWLLEGLSIDQPKAIRAATPGKQF